MTAPAVVLHGIARRFGHQWVLRGLDLDVEPGEVIGMTGRNGSGKTTLLRICATLLRPTRGGGRVLGHDLLADAPAVREHVGMLAHESAVYGSLTAEENLSFSLQMAGLEAEARRIEGALDDVGLLRERSERTRGFSAGMKRRLALARLLLRPPSLLLLDEPYASFDADGIALVNQFAQSVAERGGAVLVATHDLTRGRSVLQRTIEIENGRIRPALAVAAQ
ncbi:MAG: heme ABC exporter ATP-binding protein CcmA [Gemmatimonadetes bacterium]|nr:heme ABC exporter ATP-binding protein CcmA [Gemmatimonadota bacterium]